MKYSLSQKNISLTDADRLYIDKKVDRLKKILDPPFVIDIRLIRDSHHQKGNIIQCRINVEHGKYVWHAERRQGSALDATDACINAISQEIKTHKGKQVARSQAHQ